MVNEHQRQTFAHRKHETNEFKTIKEALTWADPQAEEIDKNHRPNSRWLTENKDKFRTFIPGSDVIQGNQAADGAATQEVDLHPESFEQVLNDSTDRIDVAPIQKKTVKILQDEKSDVQSVRTATKPKKKISAAQRKLIKDMKQRKSTFNNTTRWLADSAFTTYFGKPAFHPYGRANTSPAVGGINYGHAMLTHNINAECGENPPLYQ